MNVLYSIADKASELYESSWDLYERHNAEISETLQNGLVAGALGVLMGGTSTWLGHQIGIMPLASFSVLSGAAVVGVAFAVWHISAQVIADLGLRRDASEVIGLCLGSFSGSQLLALSCGIAVPFTTVASLSAAAVLLALVAKHYLFERSGN